MSNTLKHNLRVEPYEYQREGICFGLQHKRIIIGDEPGLGKTLQSIGEYITKKICCAASSVI